MSVTGAPSTTTTTAPTSCTRSGEPLVLVENGCSYRELIWLVSKLPISSRQKDDDDDDDHHHQVLPPEILRRIANFLTVDAVDPSQVVAVGCSSTDGRHSPRCCLEEDTSTWWISGIGRMPNGKGEEFVEFQLARQKRVVRLSSFGIEIPPLPMGPLSVRTLRVDCKVDASTNTWKHVSPIWTIENKTGWQTFSFPKPVDAEYVRVECLSNQISLFLRDSEQTSDAERNLLRQYSCVGFYHVKFE
jgi:hypothetical protein